MIRDRVLDFRQIVLVGVGVLIGLLYPAFEWWKFGSPAVNVIADNMFYPYGRHFMPFWWGMVADVKWLLSGHAMTLLVLFTIIGLLWLCFSFVEHIPSALLYGLFILSFPVITPHYTFATFGDFRYFCGWPGAYSGLGKMLESRIGFVLVAIGSFVVSLVVAFLIAQKVFLF
jgi:hypothetical protein